MATSLRERLLQKQQPAPATQPTPTATPVAQKEQPVSPLQAEEPQAPEKPLTFAEKLALKRQEAAAAAPIKEAAKPVALIDPARLPDDPQTGQALSDIDRRIKELENLMDDDLRHAMGELKQALKQNPSAAELILDEDVGKMVSALRRMRQLAVVNTPKTTKAKTKPKTKEVQFSKEELEAAWNEL